MEFFWQCLISLFAVVDPLAAAATFATLTATDSLRETRAMARRAALAASGVLFLFLIAGEGILLWFSISFDAFRIAGGIILAVMALDLLKATNTGVRATSDERDEGLRKVDVSVTPIAFPLLAGPGAISTVMVFASSQPGIGGMLTIGAVILLVGLAIWLLLSFASTLVVRLGATGMNVSSRLLGMLLLAIAVQFVLDGVRGFLG